MTAANPTIAVPAATSPVALLESLNARYAVKQFDPEKAVPRRTWEALLESLRLAPTAYGLPHAKFFVVETPELRAKLREASWGQAQITDADRLVVLAARKDLGRLDVERYLDRVAEVRATSRTELAGFEKMLLGAIGRPDLDAWTRRQVYIALGFLLTSAAALGVDACPMEGFDAAKYDELLGLREKGCTAQVVAALGYRSERDAYAALPKVRLPLREAVETL